MISACEFFQSHGGCIELDLVGSVAKERYLQQLRFYDHIDPTIEKAIIYNMGFNAVASKDGDKEYIGLYVGAITKITLIAYQLFSDPEFFPYIGKSNLENVDISVIEILQKNTFSGILSHRYLPNDSERINAAERVAECACLILYLHESAHIRGCHLDIIGNYFGLTEYEEINMFPINEAGSLLLRALELEADSLALINGLSIWRELSKNTTSHSVKGLQATQLWLISAELLFWVMSMSLYKKESVQVNSHPSLLTREINLRMIRGRSGIIDKKIIKAFKDDRHEVSRWFQKHNISSQIISLSNDENMSSEDKISEFMELTTKIKEIWSEIERLQSIRIQKICK